MDYPPGPEEVNPLAVRHPELSRTLLETIVGIANSIRGKWSDVAEAGAAWAIIQKALREEKKNG